MFHVYRSPPHPSDAYALIGSHETLPDAVYHLHTVALCVEEDADHPGHYDAISEAGTLYSIVPAGSRWTPARIISRLEA